METLQIATQELKDLKDDLQDDKFRYGERVFKKIKQVQELKCRGEFKVIAQRVPRSKVEERLIKPIVGLMSENVCSRLMEDEVGTLGLYGMGGVGKTTLLSQINNSCIDTVNDFDVVVSKDQKIECIQETILKRLGRWNEEWKHRNVDEKSSAIYQILKGKRYMLLLDDLWSELDIQKIGIPLPTSLNRCKVVFTTRSKEVCSEMRVDVEIEVKCLASDEAWELFRMRVGDITLKSHPGILELAREMAKKCYGLPLALNVIGETMASRRTIQEWSHARHVLTSFAAEFSGMQDKILPILKFSYDNLQDDVFRKCLQYCALFPEDYEIEKEELVEYWICEGIIDGSKDRGKATNHGYEIIGTLVRACLLMDYEHTEYLKMHGMVREMVLWISADLGKKKDSFIVKAGAKLSDFPEVKDWSVVHKMSLMENRIEKIKASPCGATKLVTLFLQNNKLVNISEHFLKCMKELMVLDLSSNESLTELPAAISELVSLTYLNLSSTRIEMLPVGIKELRKVVHLDLEYTHKLKSVAGISKLLSLQVLRLFESNVPLSDVLVMELQSLKHLKLLTLTLKDASVMERILKIHSLVKFTRHLSLDNCIPKSIRISLMAASSDLCGQGMTYPDIPPEITTDWRQQHLTSASTLCFRSLTRADIVNCEGLRDLTWLIYAPNLTSLHVEMSFQIEEIISRDKVTEINKEELKPFQKLESLSLLFLYAVESMYWSPLPFSALKYLKILRCPKLMKLPLDSESAKGCDLVLDAYGRWLQDVEWEDEATKNRFCPP